MGEHKAIRPGYQGACPANVTTFQNDPLPAHALMPKKPWIDELRVSVAAEEVRRNILPSPTTYTDPTITAGTTNPRKPHIDELRAAIYALRNPSGYPNHSCPTNQDGCVCEAHTIGYILNNGSWTEYCSFCQDYCKTNVKGYCSSDVTAQIDWTDPSITARVTPIHGTHFNEMRTKLNAQKQQCVCESERCSYCADCGHSYLNRSSPGCSCDDHKYSECMYSESWVHNCATVDEDTLDFTTALQANLPSGITSGANVPWNCMCSFTPPGSTWSNRKGHAVWGCMCNPFRWLGG